MTPRYGPSILAYKASDAFPAAANHCAYYSTYLVLSSNSFSQIASIIGSEHGASDFTNSIFSIFVPKSSVVFIINIMDAVAVCSVVGMRYCKSF